jgi:CBS domain-containing protein
MHPFHETSIDDVPAFPMSSTALQTPISEIMSREVICVGPETSLSGLTEVLILKGISGVPVVDADGRPLGVASKTDVLRCPATEGETARAKDVMTPVTLAMPAHASVARAAALMSYERVHRVVVVAPSGAIVGLVSTMDVLRWLARNDGYAVP